MSNPNFSQSLYDASLSALTQNGVPQEIAEAASIVVASDQPGQPNLGRSEEDQQAVDVALLSYWDYLKGKLLDDGIDTELEEGD